MKNKLTAEEIRHIAKLSNLPLDEKEIEKFSSQVSEIIEFNVEHLKKINTDGVDPTAHALGVTNRVRSDIPEAGLSQKQALQNARETHNNFFKVEAVLNKDKR